MLQFLIKSSFAEVLRAHLHWNTATLSHPVMALLLASVMMMWWSIFVVLSVYVLDHLVERKSFPDAWSFRRAQAAAQASYRIIL